MRRLEVMPSTIHAEDGDHIDGVVIKYRLPQPNLECKPFFIHSYLLYFVHLNYIFFLYNPIVAIFRC